MDIDEVQQEAELVTGPLGTTLEQLHTQPVESILTVLREERNHNETETMTLIERFAGRGYIPHSYIDEARHLLSTPQ
jgi:hypothetical protein